MHVAACAALDRACVHSRIWNQRGVSAAGHPAVAASPAAHTLGSDVRIRRSTSRPPSAARAASGFPAVAHSTAGRTPIAATTTSASTALPSLRWHSSRGAGEAGPPPHAARSASFRSRTRCSSQP